MDKRDIENFRSHQTRRAMRMALHQARTATLVQPRVPQVRELTANERDRFMHRRIEREQTIRNAAAALLAKKKKLPMPVFPCENERHHESDLINGETDQVRPRVLGEGAK